MKTNYIKKTVIIWLAVASITIIIRAMEQHAIALHLAARKNQVDSLLELLNEGADVNAQSASGYTALHWAAQNGHIDAVGILLAYSADATVVNVSGESASKLAEDNGHEAVRAILLKVAESVPSKESKPLVKAIKKTIKLKGIVGHAKAPQKIAVKGMKSAGAKEASKQIIKKMYMPPKTIPAKSPGAQASLPAATLSKSSVSPSLLWVAAREGHIGRLKELLSEGHNINVLTKDGWSALLYAVSEGHLAATQFLVENKANINITIKDGWNPLLLAINRGHEGICLYLIDQGQCDIHAALENGENALSMAQSCSLSEVCKLLSEKLAVASESQSASVSQPLTECNVHEVDVMGRTAMHYACSEGVISDIQKFLALGAQVSKGDNHGWTPLHFSASNGHKTVCSLLLEVGADAMARNSQGSTPAQLAQANGHNEIYRLLSKRTTKQFSAAPLSAPSVIAQPQVYMDNNKISDDGKTALHKAAEKGSLYAVREILKGKVDKDAVDKAGYTAYQYAQMKGHIAICQLLNETSASTIAPAAQVSQHVTAANAAIIISGPIHVTVQRNIELHAQNSSPLHEAIPLGSKAIAKLIKEGADLNARDSDGRTPLHMAALNGDTKTCELLKKEDATDLNPRDNTGCTPLHLAARNGHTKTCELLIKNKFDYGGMNVIKRSTRLNVCNNNGETALFLAACNGHAETCEFLLKRGAFANTSNAAGLTALQTIQASGKPEIKQMLHKHAPKLDCIKRDEKGRVSIHFQALAGNEKARIKFLLGKNGVDINMPDNEGKRALHLAIESTQHDESKGRDGLIENIWLCELFISYGAFVNAVDKNGVTPLHLAAQRGHLKTCKLLLENGALINARNNIGETPFSLAKFMIQGGNTYVNVIEVCDFLMENDADPLITPSHGRTKLHEAALHGESLLLSRLLQRGALVDQADAEGNTPLHLAVCGIGWYNSSPAFKFQADCSVCGELIRAGANANLKNRAGETAMRRAQLNGKDQLCQYLLDLGVKDTRVHVIRAAAERTISRPGPAQAPMGANMGPRPPFGKRPMKKFGPKRPQQRLSYKQPGHHHTNAHGPNNNNYSNDAGNFNNYDYQDYDNQSTQGHEYDAYDGYSPADTYPETVYDAPMYEQPTFPAEPAVAPMYIAPTPMPTGYCSPYENYSTPSFSGEY